MTQVMLICLAALANVVLNLSLKTLTRQIEAPTIGAMLAKVPLSPGFWLSATSGIALIVLFMAAIRSGSVAVAYIGITSIAMIGLTLASALIYHDIPGAHRIAGLGFVLVGVLLTLAD